MRIMHTVLLLPGRIYWLSRNSSPCRSTGCASETPNRINKLYGNGKTLEPPTQYHRTAGFIGK